MIVAGISGSILVALDGHVLPALAMAAVAGVALAWRRWFMARLDMLLVEREAGAAGVAGRLRRLDVADMLVNATQLMAVIASGPSLVMMG